MRLPVCSTEGPAGRCHRHRRRAALTPLYMYQSNTPLCVCFCALGQWDATTMAQPAGSGAKRQQAKTQHSPRGGEFCRLYPRMSMIHTLVQVVTITEGAILC